MLSYCVRHFNRKNKTEINTSAKALRRLLSECEREKRNLSSVVETVIDIDCLYEGLDFHMKITRAKFEELNTDFFGKCMRILNKCLARRQDEQREN
jgi:heat shock protein 1/8